MFIHFFRETEFLDYNVKSEKNTSYNLTEFQTYVLAQITNVKYSMRNKWFDHVKRLFLHVILVLR